MKQPKICAVITRENQQELLRSSGADLFELRIDLVGPDWPNIVESINRPWIATNRIADEGGGWRGSEDGRIEMLIKAIEAGASIVDIELATPRLKNVVAKIKEKCTCLISYHDFNRTPSIVELKDVIKRQIEAGADICKVATMARCDDDNITVLELIKSFTIPIVVMAMGEIGRVSRLLAPLAGAAFGYAALNLEDCSSSGQMTVAQMRIFYGVICP
jgi:3-dehydroquinate dehydratase-1